MLNECTVGFHMNLKLGTKAEMRSICMPILHTNFSPLSEVSLVVAQWRPASSLNYTSYERQHFPLELVLTKKNKVLQQNPGSNLVLFKENSEDPCPNHTASHFLGKSILPSSVIFLSEVCTPLSNQMFTLVHKYSFYILAQVYNFPSPQLPICNPCLFLSRPSNLHEIGKTS